MPYQPLLDRLAREQGDVLTLTFAQIEKIVGFALPLRTDTDRWRNATRDPARAWRALGWHARLEYPARRVIFRRRAVGVDGAATRRTVGGAA